MFDVRDVFVMMTSFGIAIVTHSGVDGQHFSLQPQGMTNER
jgi:hypothetical protein